MMLHHNNMNNDQNTCILPELKGECAKLHQPLLQGIVLVPKALHESACMQNPENISGNIWTELPPPEQVTAWHRMCL